MVDGDVLIDTSVAVPIVLADHEAHEATIKAVRDERLGLSGHAWFETYSVLTRLPPGARRSPEVVQALLQTNFPVSRFLDAAATLELPGELARLGIAGGAVYDALVGAAARAHELPLLSRDRRARSAYEKLGVDVRFLD